MKENMPVPEFSEKETELINFLKEKGVCQEVRELLGAWRDAEQAKPEWKEVKHGKENNEKNRQFYFLQVRLELKQVKILIEAHVPNEDLEEALSSVYQQIDGMVTAGIDCYDFQEEYFKLADQVDANYQ